MLIAILCGIAAGLLCPLLPGRISNYLVNDLAEPILNVAIKLMSGVIGSILFISLVTAISTLDSASEFNRMGTKIFRRFLVITIFLTGLAMTVALCIVCNQQRTDRH